MNRLLLTLKRTGFFRIFTASVINKLIGFVGGIILVRILTKTEYGEYEYSNNIYGFFTLFSGFGMVSAILQVCSETADRDTRLRSYQVAYRIGVLVNFGIGIVVLGVSFLLPLPISGSNSILKMLSFSLVFSFIMGAQLNYLLADGRNREYSNYSILASLLRIILVSIFSLCFKIKGLILAIYSAEIIVVMIQSRYSGIPTRILHISTKSVDINGLLKIGFISTLNNGLSQLMSILSIFILGVIIADGSVIASYKIASIIPSALILIPASVITYVYPHFARNKNNRIWLLLKYRDILIYLGLFNLILVSSLFITAPLLITTIFGLQYADTIPVFRILLISYFVSGTFGIVSGNLLVTQRRLKANLFISIMSSGLNTLLNVYMITKWRSEGAAIATLVTIIMTSIISTSYLIRVLRHIT